jgi:hypothetical protein
MLATQERKAKPDGSRKGTFGGSEKTLPPGIDKKESHKVQEIYRHPEVVEKCKIEYRAANRRPGFVRLADRSASQGIHIAKDATESSGRKRTGKDRNAIIVK